MDGAVRTRKIILLYRIYQAQTSQLSGANRRNNRRNGAVPLITSAITVANSVVANTSKVCMSPMRGKRIGDRRADGSLNTSAGACTVVHRVQFSPFQSTPIKWPFNRHPAADRLIHSVHGWCSPDAEDNFAVPCIPGPNESAIGCKSSKQTPEWRCTVNNFSNKSRQ